MDVLDHFHVVAVKTGFFGLEANLFANVTSDLFKIDLVFGYASLTEKNNLEIKKTF
jgi:hypothetical protein